jgi:hypothetical protein
LCNTGWETVFVLTLSTVIAEYGERMCHVFLYEEHRLRQEEEYPQGKAGKRGGIFAERGLSLKEEDHV